MIASARYRIVHLVQNMLKGGCHTPVVDDVIMPGPAGHPDEPSMVGTFVQSTGLGRSVPLTQSTKELLSDDEIGLALRSTADHYPEIVNHLAEIWDCPYRVMSSISEWSLREHGDRFSIAVDTILELAELESLYQSKIERALIG